MLLEKHTMAQAISGGVQGFFLTVLEMYLFMSLLNLPVTGLTGLYESVLFVLAIIATPILLGILSYINVRNPLSVFILLEIVLLVMFFALTPAEVFIIFALITLASVLISFYAGDGFIWYKIISGQSFSTL